jgi:probable HAF family extracellular repeat protein
VYTAPVTPGTYTIQATSAADTSKTAQVQIVVGTDAFIHTGDLPGGIFSSGIQGLNVDGTTAVGFGTPTPPSGQAAANNAISYASNSSGSLIVGARQLTGIKAFQYTGGVVTELADLPGASGPSAAFGVDGVGNIIVGQASTSTSATHAAKWVNGVVTDLGVLSGGSFSLARAISVDGTVIVGESGVTIGARAVRWVNGAAGSSLGVFSGGTESLANAVNANGSVIVGESGSNAGGTPHTAAFKWTSGGGLVDLGNLGGSSLNARAFGVSADGTIIVGESQTGATVNDTEAFIWTAGGGMQKVQTVLSSHGMSGPLTGWTLLNATCISQDGKVIGGLGKNPSGKPEGWIAILP